MDDRHVVQPGDLLVSWSATLGAYIWDGPEGVLNQYIFKVRSRIDKTYHYHLIGHILDELYRHTHGSGMVHITKRSFEDTLVPVPPLAEQRRIVTAVEALSGRVNAARERLAKVPAILKRFRQSVLAAACSGRLTEDWREEHECQDSVEGLLSRLERDAESFRDENRGRRAGVEKDELPDVHWEFDSETPPTWRMVDVSDLIDIQNGRAFPSKEYCDEGIRLLRPGNLHVSGDVQWDAGKYSVPATSVERGVSRIRPRSGRTADESHSAVTERWFLGACA